MRVFPEINDYINTQIEIGIQHQERKKYSELSREVRKLEAKLAQLHRLDHDLTAGIESFRFSSPEDSEPTLDFEDTQPINAIFSDRLPPPNLPH